MNNPSLKVAYLTAGAAGMYCGSCMHDNTLASALGKLGVDVQLIPTYTPIRTDEKNVSIDRVFFGGINVYLQQKIPLFRHLPNLVDRFLDQPWLLRVATAQGIEANGRDLGALTVSMLRGTCGYQRKEVNRLCDYLAHHAKPDLINLSNMLIAGCTPTIKERLKIPIVVTLQGDDVFLDELPEPFKSRAFDEIRELVKAVDAFIVNSRYYADFMAEYFAIPAEKFRIVPLGLDTSDFDRFLPPGDRHDDGGKTDDDGGQQKIGYLARLAPEKGLHVLVDAFIELRSGARHENFELHLAGWLGKNNRQYAAEQFDKLRAAGLEHSYRYWGSVDRKGKLDFLRQLDVLSVPTIYHDPKGLFVLEALAAGVPVVQPQHGAFPEMLEDIGGGKLVRPDDPHQLAEALNELLNDVTLRRQFAGAGQVAVRERRNSQVMAVRTLEIYRELASIGLGFAADTMRRTT